MAIVIMVIFLATLLIGIAFSFQSRGALRLEATVNFDLSNYSESNDNDENSDNENDEDDDSDENSDNDEENDHDNTDNTNHNNENENADSGNCETQSNGGETCEIENGSQSIP